MNPKLPKTASHRLLTPKGVPGRRRKAEGWSRRRKTGLQPWLRGRIRPSSCKDLAGEK